MEVIMNIKRLLAVALVVTSVFSGIEVLSAAARQHNAPAKRRVVARPVAAGDEVVGLVVARDDEKRNAPARHRQTCMSRAMSRVRFGAKIISAASLLAGITWMIARSYYSPSSTDFVMPETCPLASGRLLTNDTTRMQHCFNDLLVLAKDAFALLKQCKSEVNSAQDKCNLAPAHIQELEARVAALVLERSQLSCVNTTLTSWIPTWRPW